MVMINIFDKAKSGLIHRNNFTTVLQQHKIPQEFIDKVFDEIDINNFEVLSNEKW